MMRVFPCALTVLAIAVAGCDKAAVTPGHIGPHTGLPEFGTATANNIAVHSGQANHRINLANRFANDVQSTVTFPFNSAQLTAQAQATLRGQADWIKRFPEVRFRVYGHTDLVGGSSYNQRLGLRRARAVVSYLVGQGISRSRLEAVVSKGETQPLIVTQGREERNRRTVTEVTGFVSSHPTVMNGQYAEIIMREYVQSASSAPELTGGAFAPGMSSGE